MKFCAVTCVKDSHILLSASIQHLALNGIEDFYIYDHGSEPALANFLEKELKSEKIRLQILRKESGPFFQREMVNVLTTLARDDGFDMVVAFDADEFWCSTANGISLIDQITQEFGDDIDILRVPVINYAQHRDVEAFGIDSLARCRYSVTPIRDDTQHARDLVDAGIPFLAIPFPPKVITRLSPDIKFTMGQHFITKASGDIKIRDASCIVVRHLPMPSKDHIFLKREQGLRLIAGDYPMEVGWQAQRLAYASDDELTAYWENNSWHATDDQSAAVGAYDGTVFDDALAQIGAELAGNQAGAHPGPSIAGSVPMCPSSIPAKQLERVIQSLVDDQGVAERVIENLRLALARASAERDQALSRRRPLPWRVGVACIEGIKHLERRIRHCRKGV